MFYTWHMNTLEKLKSFSLNMPFETAEDASTGPGMVPREQELTDLKREFPVTMAHLPNGKQIPLLKTMQTSVCERDCNYCCFRSGRDFQRANLTPDELAGAIVKLSRAGIAQGVFLSSGICGGGVRTQDRIIATAELLRQKFRYSHYIHLKIMPGAEEDQIFRAMQLADRVSINLEGPDETSLQKLAPHKRFFNELMHPLRIIQEIRTQYAPHLAWKGTWPSSCTQFVVGAVGETDLSLLNTTNHLQQQFRISRAYFSKFSPVVDTPFENLPPLNPWRQHRLYQAFYLLNTYHYDLEEIEFNSSGNLSLEKDPKIAWAELHLRENPIEINTASYPRLLRVPGIGPASARKILALRKHGKIRELTQLRGIGVSFQRAAKFILLDGVAPPYQPGLFN